MASGIMKIMRIALTLLSIGACAQQQPVTSTASQAVASPVVTIQYPEQGKDRTSGGVGILIRPDGYIVTNSHLLKDVTESSIKVLLNNGSSLPVRIVGNDPKTDLAVLKIDGNNFPYFPWAAKGTAHLGDEVVIVGARGPIANATIRKMGENQGLADYEDTIEIQGNFTHADFGGALLNMNGELVGINFGYDVRYEGTGWAISNDLAQVITDSLIKSGTVNRAWTGLGIQMVTPDLAKAFHVKEYEGVLVSDVYDYGPAAKAGIKRGDVIVEVDGQAISSVSMYRNLISFKAIGSTVKIKIIRDGRPEFVAVQILLRTPETSKR